MGSGIPELDLHGYTLEGAEQEVDRELNLRFLKGDFGAKLHVITGWGGRLRPAIGKYLQNHPLVQEVRQEGPGWMVYLEDLS